MVLVLDLPDATSRPINEWRDAWPAGILTECDNHVVECEMGNTNVPGSLMKLQFKTNQ